MSQHLTDREAMQQALEALEWVADEHVSAYDNQLGAAILALRERLATPEDEPMSWQDHILFPQNEKLLYALTRLVEHDEYMIERGKLHHFMEVEQARGLINSIRGFYEQS